LYREIVPFLPRDCLATSRWGPCAGLQDYPNGKYGCAATAGVRSDIQTRPQLYTAAQPGSGLTFRHGLGLSHFQQCFAQYPHGPVPTSAGYLTVEIVSECQTWPRPFGRARVRMSDLTPAFKNVTRVFGAVASVAVRIQPNALAGAQQPQQGGHEVVQFAQLDRAAGCRLRIEPGQQAAGAGVLHARKP